MILKQILEEEKMGLSQNGTGNEPRDTNNVDGDKTRVELGMGVILPLIAVLFFLFFSIYQTAMQFHIF